MSHRIPTPTAHDVIAAVHLCNQLGVEQFCKAHGYAPAPRARYVLRVGGKSYPAKAILGVASQLSPRDFSGGAGHACRVLRRLGFTIREGRPRGLDQELSLVARGLEFPFGPLAAPTLPIEPVAYFASGSNHAGEIAAFADLGHDIGVSAREIGPTGIAALLALAGTDVQVFADSGAFGERDRKTFELTKPMTELDWDRVLGIYDQLSVLGDQLHVVATDRVGCQTTTIELLLRYRDRLRALHARGVRVLMPVQKGSRTQADFYRRCCEILGFEPVPALPCKKAATTTNEAADFVAAIQPRTVHLLGLGMRSPKAFDFLYRISLTSPGTQIQMDAVVIAAMVGRDGIDGKARRLTAAHDVAAQLATTVTRLADATWRKYLGLVLALGGVGAAS